MMVGIVGGDKIVQMVDMDTMESVGKIYSDEKTK